MHPLKINQENLLHLTPLPSGLEEKLKNASLHALNSEGSFSRALLAGNLALRLGLPISESEKLGVSIELFHLASLLLDDLPCMDDAELRRSSDCTHRLYGENSTILAALGFINQAYFHLWQLFGKRSGTIQNEAALLCRQCLGFEGILDGQSKDMNYVFVYNDGSMVSEIARKKTGSLIRMCLMLPAILTDAGRYEKFHLSNLADDWGLAYQIADDLKDIFFGDAVSGKSAQRDAELCRPNMALAVGEDSAASSLSRLLEKAEGRISALERSKSGAYLPLRQFQDQFSEKTKSLLQAFAAA